MSNQFSLVLRRLAAEPPVIRADEAKASLGTVQDDLESIGLLKRLPAAGSAVCTDCGSGHLCTVQFVRHEKTGATHAYICCPECGTQELPRERLGRLGVDVPGFLSRLIDAAGLQGTLRECVPGHLWYLGRVTWGLRSREVYFGRRFHRDTLAACRAELARRPKSILLVPTEECLTKWSDAVTNQILALETILSLEGTTLTLDQQYVHDRLTDAGLAGATVPKRRTRKRADRAGKIEALKKEMIAHLQAARSHAFATKDQSGVPSLLPRPSQQELAKRTGMTESDVSRCLKDKSANELRLYWDMALDFTRS